jgi:hypothetical protein
VRTFDVGAVAFILFVIIVLVAYLLARRDPMLRQMRVGFFVERERFDEDELERGFDEDPPVSRHYPAD